MIRSKGLDFERRDLIPDVHVLLVRRDLGFLGRDGSRAARRPPALPRHSGDIAGSTS